MTNNPLYPGQSNGSDDAAVQLIRSKVERALGHEPSASEEIAEVQGEKQPSKHQRYMQELSGQGKSLAEIQTAWHHYYTTLSDIEKHEVWQEFYAANQHTPYQKLFQKQQAAAGRMRDQPTDLTGSRQPVPTPMTTPSGAVVATHESDQPKHRIPAHAAKQIRKHKPKAAALNPKGKLTAKHNLQSLLFGLGVGAAALAIMLFTFFNEYIIAPFIQPSRTVSATPIILGDDSANANLPPSVTIPKINIQIPINFNVSSTDESLVEDGLKSGVVHYPNTVLPGQNGNGAYFGHSSGNIFNNGKYKFAFTLLHNLTTGDIFYINYNGKTYAYKIFAREVVPPSDVGVITDTKGKQATATLITCDPPGISTNRLVLWGEQISPAITGNSNGTAQAVSSAPAELAGNGPTLFSRVVNDLEFWN